MVGRSLALLASVALAASPALAQPSAHALSIGPAVERAGAETGAGNDLRGRGSLFPAMVAAAIVIAGVLVALGVFWDDDGPDSP